MLMVTADAAESARPREGAIWLLVNTALARMIGPGRLWSTPETWKSHGSAYDPNAFPCVKTGVSRWQNEVDTLGPEESVSAPTLYPCVETANVCREFAAVTSPGKCVTMSQLSAIHFPVLRPPPSTKRVVPVSERYALFHSGRNLLLACVRIGSILQPVSRHLEFHPIASMNGVVSTEEPVPRAVPRAAAAHAGTDGLSF
jgi:hypothetical protein